ncbi:hypothetical protein V6N11_008993 [Hibiscus sabdariffa]|uniref:Retrotransposon Copia-like N-terminal domain-containing protein n=1 Tax=Hibiscus sabdariffa TaxID=183260 RepID=A0ABR2PPN8_9ROSI
MSHSDLHVAVGTTLKFNSRNYAFWLQSFHTFLGSQGCDHHLVQTMADTKDSKYVAWGQYDCAMKTWLLNSLEPEIAASVGLISTANEMWDSIEEMFPNDGNNSRIFSLFQQLVDNKQGEKSLPEFFTPYPFLSPIIVVNGFVSTSSGFVYPLKIGIVV